MNALFMTFIMLGIVGFVGLILLPFYIFSLSQSVLAVIGSIIIVPFILFISIMIGRRTAKDEDREKYRFDFYLQFFIGFFILPSFFGIFIFGKGFINILENINSNFARQNINYVGRISNTNGDLLNNRLVLIYLKNVEIGRTISITGKSGFNDVVTDGFFSVKIPNTYEIKAIEMENKKVSQDIRYDLQSMYILLGEDKEGTIETFSIPSRKLIYVIKILEGDKNSLPPEMLQTGSTHLRDDGQIIVALPGSITTDGTQTSDIVIRDINYSTKTEQIETNKLTVPINNCAGSVEVSQKYSQTQTFVHQYTGEIGFNIGVEIPLPLWAKLTPEFTAKYGFENGQVDTRTVEYNMAAAPGTNIVYIVTWSEIWESGAANLGNGTNTITVPFRVKTNLIYDIASEPRTCP